MRKTYSEYINYIKLMLGAVSDNLKSIEFSDNDLTNYVKIAFNEILPYISVRDRVTLPWNGKANGAVDLSEFNIRAKSVTAVRRGTMQGYLNTNGLYGIWSSYSVTPDGTYPEIPLFTLGGSAYCYSGSLNNDPWVTEKLILKLLNTASGDGHFLFDYGKQLLFMNFNSQTPLSVTIDFIPEYRTAEDISNDYWTMILQKKSLALVKLALSQYRGKYSNVEGAPFTLDYQRLQNEGNELNQQIQEILEENLLNFRFD